MPRSVPVLLLLAALLTAGVLLLAKKPPRHGEPAHAPAATEKDQRPVAARPGRPPAIAARTDSGNDASAVPAAQFAVACNAEQTQWPDDAGMGRMLATLADSDNAEHLLVAALLTSLPAGNPDIELMGRALDADPGHPLINWNLVQYCGNDFDSALCLGPGLYDRALGVDGTNGALWAQIAINRLDSNNAESALAAMRRANTAPEFNFYVIEHVLMFERSFATAADLSYGDRVDQAIAATAWIVPAGARVFAACQDRAAHSAEWQVQCLRFGQRLERDGNTFVSTVVGLSMQALALELANDTGNVALANLRYEGLMREFRNDPMEQTASVLQYDSRIAEKFVDEWLAHGELAAHRLVRVEFERLKSQPGFDPCRLTR